MLPQPGYSLRPDVHRETSTRPVSLRYAAGRLCHGSPELQRESIPTDVTAPVECHPNWETRKTRAQLEAVRNEIWGNKPQKAGEGLLPGSSPL